MLRKFTITLLIALAVLAIATGIAWRLLNDETYLKNKAVKLVSDLTGRELVIEGPLQLQLGALTTLTASDVSLSNAPWIANDGMLKVDHLLVRLDPWSFFSSQVNIREIRLESVDLMLATNEHGENNWDIFPKTGDSENMQQSPVRIGYVQLVDFSLIHETPTREVPLEAQLEKVLLERQESGNIDLAISGNIDGQPLQLNGTAGPVSSLVTGGAFSHELELSLGKIILDISGSMDEVSTGTGVFLEINFAGPEFGRVTEYLDLPGFSSGPFDLNLLVNTEADMARIKLQGDLGTLDLVANGEVDKLLQPTEAFLKLQVTGPDLQAMGETFGVVALPAVPYRVNLDTELEAGRSTINSLVVELDSDRIEISGDLGVRPDYHDSELRFETSGSDLSRWGQLLGVRTFAARPFSLNGAVSSDHTGALSTTAQLQTGDNSLRINGPLGTLPKFNGANLEVTLKSPDLSNIVIWPGTRDVPAVPINLQGQIGKSEQGLMLSNILLEMDGNRAEIDGLISLTDDFQGSQLQSKIDLPSFAALGRYFGVSDLPDQPLQITGSVQPYGTGIEFEIEDGNLGGISLSAHGNLPDLSSIQGLEVQLSIVLPSLRLASFLIGDMDLPNLPVRAEGMVRREGNQTRFSNVVINTGDAVIRIDADLSAEKGLAGSTININAKGPDLARFVPLPELQTLPQDFTARGQWVIGEEAETINDFELTLGSMKLNLNGSADDLLHPSELKLGILAGGPDISLLNEFLGQSLRPEAFSVNTGFEGSLEAFKLEEFRAQLGESDMAGNLQVTLGDSPGISGVLNSDYLDVSQWRNESREPSEDDRSSGSDPDSGFVFPDTRLVGIDGQFFDLDLNLDLDVTINDLYFGNGMLKDVQLGVYSKEHMFRLDPLQFRDVTGSSIQGIVQIDVARTVPELMAKLEGRDFRIGVRVVKDQPLDMYPPTDIFLDIRGTGETYREMAASLNGRIRLYQGEGRIANSGLGLIFSDLINELFSVLNPFTTSSPYSNLECSVLVADIASGKVTLHPVIFQTDKLILLSNGVIDLNRELIDLTFNTRVRKGIGISAGMVVNPFIKLGGSLSSPKIQVDPKSTAITGGLAAATAGLSLLFKPLADRYLSARNPCQKMVEETKQRDAELH